MGTELIKKPSNEIASRVQEIAAEDQDDLAVMAYVVQVAAAIHLSKMRKLEESKIPTGVKPIKMTIPDTITKIQLGVPWISFALLNDGTGDLTCWVNDEEDPLQESMVLSGESYSTDMTYPVIRAIYLKAGSGTTAAVRIYGKVGRLC